MSNFGGEAAVGQTKNGWQYVPCGEIQNRGSRGHDYSSSVGGLQHRVASEITNVVSAGTWAFPPTSVPLICPPKIVQSSVIGTRSATLYSLNPKP